MAQEKHCVPKLMNQEDCKVSLLDMPDVILDCILKRLPPLDLFRVSQACTYLRNIGRSDDLWETHIEHKWSKLVGNDAHHEWQWHTTKIINEGSIIFLPENKENLLLQQSLSGSCGTISGDSPFLRLHSYLKSYKGLNGLIRNYSKMALYICLETGRFCFPAQVYKATRFTLYCYDALVSYDSKTDTFRARSPNGGRHMIEKDIHWERLRKPPHNTFLVDFYHSNCLNDLKPGDHIEIQKRRRRALPYCEWWYAVVCHLGSCDKDINHCSCRNSDTLVLEFNQYSHTVTYSLTRSAINSKVYVELTCLAGIRKLTDDEEITKWRNLIFTRNQELRLAE